MFDSKNITENHAPSRGESVLNTKDEFNSFSSESENITENFENENGLGGTYSAQNSEFDSFIDDATTTQEQLKSENITPKSKYMSPEQAMDIALKGLSGFSKLLGDYSEVDIEISQNTAMLFATLSAPLIQKYGANISLDLNNIDLDSYTPELLAVGAVAVAGYPIFQQVKKPKIKTVKKTEKPEKTKAENDGDKSKSSA